MVLSRLRTRLFSKKRYLLLRDKKPEMVTPSIITIMKPDTVGPINAISPNPPMNEHKSVMKMCLVMARAIEYGAFHNRAPNAIAVKKQPMIDVSMMPIRISSVFAIVACGVLCQSMVQMA